MLLWMVAVLLGSAILKRWGMSTFVIFYLVCAVSVVMTFLRIQWPADAVLDWHPLSFIMRQH
jgi:hypothetical protein